MLQTPSMTFHIVEDAVVILSSKGVFKQSDIYVRKNYIYAKHGSGFIRLQRHEKGTSAPSVYYDDLYLPFTPEYDNIGRMMVPLNMRQ